jgi:hypothetical protein
MSVPKLETVGGVGPIMRLTVFTAAITFLLWGTPAFADDFDADGVEDEFDNCLEAMNPAQDDTDGDGCGNLCDWDYDDNGMVGIPDLIIWDDVVGTFGNEEQCHEEPIPGCRVDAKSFGPITFQYGLPPGPSGTTSGTTACP